MIDRKITLGLAIALLAASGCGRSYNPDPVANLAVVEALRAGGNSGDSSSGGATAATGTGWGKLKGAFVLKGSVSKMKNLSTGGKDGQVCDKHPLVDPTFKWDSGSGAIQDVVVFLRKVSRVHDSYDAMLKEPVIFDQKDCLFIDQMKVVFLGQEFLVKNSDPITHNTAISPPGDKAINPLMPAGDNFKMVFKRAQNKPVPVTCSIHPWMKAFVFPRKDPYCAVSDKDGKFEIDNVPAGEELEFQIWHAAGGGPENGLKTSKSGPDGRFKLKVTEDGEEDLQTIEIESSAFKL